MLRVTFSNRTLAFTWKHFAEDRVVPPTKRQRALINAVKAAKRLDPTLTLEAPPILTQARRSITCSIYEVNEDGTVSEKLVSAASLRIYFKDVFTRDKGRKIALSRALKFTNLNKEEREAVWQAYHDRVAEQLRKEAEAKAKKALATIKLPGETTDRFDGTPGAHAVADIHAGEV